MSSQSRRIRRALTRPIRFESVEAAQAFLLAHPQAYHVTVEHGPSCSPEVCRCKPSYVLRPCTPENIHEGARAQARWVRESLS